MKFLRRDWKRHSKLGKKRKKKQTWRRPTGRDNKMRERRKGYPKTVEIGYKNPESKVEEIFVYNLNDFKKVGKENAKQKVFIGKVGKKKRLEIAKKAKELKITFDNLNVNKTLKQIKKLGLPHDASTKSKAPKKPVEKKK
jgi:large subunit ribosomal protein L32e